MLSRLYEKKRAEEAATYAADRKSQVGTGDRSERIRTYNFPQDRISDHRIGFTLYNLPKVIAGEALDDVIDPLIAEDQAARLATAGATSRPSSRSCALGRGCIVRRVARAR